MQRIICNLCERRITGLSVRFSVTYSTEIRLTSSGDYSAQMNTLAVEESSLDDEATIEAQCLMCGDTGTIKDIYSITYHCDGCNEQIDQPEGYFCMSKRQHFCDECADSKVESMCSWCSFSDGCSILEAYKDRRDVRLEAEREEEERLLQERLAEEQAALHEEEELPEAVQVDDNLFEFVVQVEEPQPDFLEEVTDE